MRGVDTLHVSLIQNVFNHEMSRTDGRRVMRYMQDVYDVNRAVYKTDSEQFE